MKRRTPDRKPAFSARTQSHRSLKVQPQIIEGKLAVTAKGFGFLVPANRSQDIFIPAPYLNGAIDGDEVTVSLIPDSMLTYEQRKKGLTGRVVSIANRANAVIVGELLPHKQVLPFSKRIPKIIQLVGSLRDAQIGDWVSVRLYPPKNHSDELMAELVERIGRTGSISADLDAVVAAFSLPPPYSEKEEKKAALIEPPEIPRRDCTDLFCVTIDPFDAKDHDDAMTLQQGKTPGTWILGVHIADVSAYIQPKTYWDRAAATRCFTSYLPGRTLPMLPRSLTKKISLSPGIPSAAHSVFFTIRKTDGEILKTERLHTRVSIQKSLNYDEVQNFIEGKTPKTWNKETIRQLKTMIQLGAVLRARRLKTEHALDLAIPEIRVIVDEQKEVVEGIVHKVQKSAEHLVEECMLLANTAVAQEMLENDIPAIYRVHAEPDPEKLEQFIAFMYEAYGINTGPLLTRVDCNRFLASLPHDEKIPTIMNAFLRAMARAEYRAECEPHFGLGKKHYLHFTSPIRRYTDLLVHRQLTAYSLKKPLASYKKMEAYAELCTEKEQNVDEAYYSANDRMKLHYLWKMAQEAPDKIWHGVINRISTTLVGVEIHELNLFGAIDLDHLPLNRKKNSPKKARHKKEKSNQNNAKFKIGQSVELYVSHIDFTRGLVLFLPN